jgi:3-phosphoshikimate 1-carboxyvinyltransferase
MGVAVDRQGLEVVVEGRGPEALQAPSQVLDCGNSGTTLRLLAGVLAACPFESTLTGDASLQRRPVERVAAPLRAMGARLSSSDGRPPLQVTGAALRGIDWKLEVASAQVKTAVLIAGLLASGRTRVHEPHLSRDHTERLLPAMGAPVDREDGWLAVSPCSLHGISMTVPGDVSSAAFLIIAGLIAEDGDVRILDVSLNPGRVGFLAVLREMGADLRIEVTSEEPEPRGNITARSSRLRNVRIAPEQVASLVDEIPALAIAAAFAEGELHVSGARELRVKESDRIKALALGLGAMGVRVEEREDGLSVHGGARPHGARVGSFGDHRIAMAFAIAGLGCRDGSQTEIEESECVAVSFPDFFERLSAATAGDA